MFHMLSHDHHIVIPLNFLFLNRIYIFVRQCFAEAKCLVGTLATNLQIYSKPFLVSFTTEDCKIQESFEIYKHPDKFNRDDVYPLAYLGVYFFKHSK